MSAVDQKMKSLFRVLMGLEFLDKYYLAGGTNLAMRYNHRTSIDLDLFCHSDFSIERSNQLNMQLKKVFEKRIDTQVSEIGVFSFIDGIKVDFVYYPYKLLHEVEELLHGRFASVIDVGAMKINAIVGRGSRKDFFDIHRIIMEIPLQAILEAYQIKYKIDRINLAKRSLIYFEDAEDREDRDNLYNPVGHKPGWRKIKRDIVAAVRDL